MLADQRLDLRDHLGGAAARQLGLDETLLGDEPQLLQTLRLGAHPFLVGELGVRLAPPQRQRLAQHRRRPGGVAAPEPRTGVGDQALEAGDVERLLGSRSMYPGACVTTAAAEPFPSTTLRIRAT